MNHNIGNMVDKTIKKKSFKIISVSVFLCIVTCVILIYNQGLLFDSTKISMQTEQSLTKEYGYDVIKTIENFHSKWATLESYKNPHLLQDIATQKYIKYVGRESEDNDYLNSPSLLITKHVEINSIRVLEYNSQKFRAIGCGEEYIDRMTPSGEIINSIPPFNFKIIYTFIREESGWKLSANYNITNSEDAARDWDHVPNWIKLEIGDFSTFIYKNCQVDFE